MITSANSKLSPARGAYTDLNELIALRHAAQDLKLIAQKRALSAISGPNRTHFRGRGIDFEEVRLYQAGDDIRTIDWRVTARSGKPHTKLFREERERPTILALDQRLAMFFGSQSCFKSVLAAHLTALVAWAALSNGDRVGGLVFNDEQHDEIRPKRHRRAVLQLLNTADQYNHQLVKDKIGQQASVSLSQMIVELQRITRPGSAIFILSDLSDFDEESEKQLYKLSQHNDITCLYLYDEMEKQLPPKGYYTFSDGRQRQRIFTGAKWQREQYQERFVRGQQHLLQRLGRLGIPLLSIATDDSPLQVLQHFFGVRRKK